MSALPADDRPALRYFLWGRYVRPFAWPRAVTDVTRLFATLEEARVAADDMAETGYYSSFAIYAIERGRLRRISSADAPLRSGQIQLVWLSDPDLPRSD